MILGHPVRTVLFVGATWQFSSGNREVSRLLSNLRPVSPTNLGPPTPEHLAIVQRPRTVPRLVVPRRLSELAVDRLIVQFPLTILLSVRWLPTLQPHLKHPGQMSLPAKALNRTCYNKTKRLGRTLLLKWTTPCPGISRLDLTWMVSS